jgi:transposase
MRSSPRIVSIARSCPCSKVKSPSRTIKEQFGTLFQLDYDLLLYDITSTYFKGLAEDNDLAKRGYSRDHRSDCKQIVIVLIVIVISDDAAVYANFTTSQKCWAHLLRKAIKLTLQDPNNTEYRGFTDRLLEIYRAACRVQRDGRLGDAGRTQKIAALDDEILDLCGPVWAAELPPLEGPDNDYRLLANEIMRLMLAQELFTFVTAKSVKQPNGETQQVGATNNEAERTLRSPAQARKTGRTNKTIAGARRQTILTSVLESLRLYLPTFTLSSVIAEIDRWIEKGRSCFAALLAKLKIPQPQGSVLERVLPNPSG